jgi:hypothetical protein
MQSNMVKFIEEISDAIMEKDDNGHDKSAISAERVRNVVIICQQKHAWYATFFASSLL